MFAIEFSLWTVLTLIVAVITAQAVGIIWYSQTSGFGRRWSKEIGLNEEEMNSAEFKRKQGKVMVYGPLVTLVLAYGLAVMLDNLLVFNILNALQIAFFLWLVLVVPTVGLNYLYNPKLSGKLFLIDAFYHLLAILVMSVVITVMM